VTDDLELQETLAELKRFSELKFYVGGDVEAGLLNRLFDFPLDFFEVQNGSAAGTGQIGVRIKRTPRLNDLLSALRARHVNSIGHASDSITTGTVGI
jgi:hypothetical protein